MDDPTDVAFQLAMSDVSEESLFVELGENNLESFGFGEATLEQKKSDGLAWWSQHADKIKTVACRAACDNDLSSAIIKDIIQLVFGLIGEKYGMGVATYAATIAVRRVVSGWCAIDESKSSA